MNNITELQKKKIKQVIAICLTGLVAIGVCILFSPFFAIEEVEVTESVYYPKEELTSYVEEFIGMNGFISVMKNTKISQSAGIFSFRLTELEEQMVFDMPYLKSVEVKYVFPDTVSISVQERVPAFLIENYGIYIHIDKEGYVLGTFTQQDMPSFPVVKGIEVNDYKIGRPLFKENNPKADMLVKMFSIMSDISMKDYIDVIDVTDISDVMMLVSPSLVIEFGDGRKELADKLIMLKGIMDEGYDGNKKGVLDFTGGNPVFR